MSQAALRNDSETDTQTVTEVLQSLSRSGMIRIDKRVIYISQVDKLRHCIEEAELTDGASLLPY